MTTDNTHYVVTVLVHRVDYVGSVKPLGGKESARVVTDLAQHTVRGDTLDGVIDRAKQHIDLLDDIAATDPAISKKTPLRG